jgi:hypothetical protein
MLFKELIGPVVTVVLFARHRRGESFAAATDNTGVTFVLNAVRAADTPSCRLLIAVVDALSEHDCYILSSHARRQFNPHADTLSRSIALTIFQGILATSPKTPVAHPASRAWQDPSAAVWDFPILVKCLRTGATRAAVIRL